MREAFTVRTANLDALNSLTKYPSIPTYHQLNPANGRLIETDPAPFRGPVIGTEKVDGTNARIICLPDETYLIGSREELLYAKGDLIGNHAQGIVPALRDLADALPPVQDDVVRVHFLEVYGGKVTAASKHYSSTKAVGFRLFDVSMITNYRALLAQGAAAISTWRDNGGQPYLDEHALTEAARRDGIPLTPRLFHLDSSALPSGLSETHDFLAGHLPSTRCALDEDAAGRPEGIVVRQPDRGVIAKARFADYSRTLRKLRG